MNVFLVALFLTSFFFIFVSLSLIRDYLSGELSLLYSATFLRSTIFSIFSVSKVYTISVELPFAVREQPPRMVNAKLNVMQNTPNMSKCLLRA